MESIKVKALPLEMDRLYERENVEVEMCRLCFTLALSQQAVTNSPFSQEFNNFKFIEAQTGFDLPANVCGQCLVQLNQLGSFLKMCKDAFNTYKLMKSNAPNIQPSPQITSDVDIIKQEAIDSESDENIFETSIDIADESEKLFTKFSDQEEFFETLTQSQTPKTELDCDDTSDPFYCDDTDMEENMNKESTSQIKTCPTCGVNVSTLFSHYSKNPKCGPRNSHCSTCNLYFGNKHRLLHHQKTHHPDEVSTTSLMCHVCSKTFQYAESLSQHLRTHENDQQDVCDQSGNEHATVSRVVELPKYIERNGQKATESLVPNKSRQRYEKEYETFRLWQSKNKQPAINETVLLTYFQELSASYSPNSLWTKYSLLKCTLIVNMKIDISSYNQLLYFLRVRSEGYTPKKSNVLTGDQVLAFIKDAPDEVYLLHKVVLVMGVFGGLTRNDIVKMSIDDIIDKGSVLVVKVPESKTVTSKGFTIVEEEEIGALKLVRQYMALRPKQIKERRFFLAYRNSRCTAQPVGKNTIGSVPSIIAKYLKLENPSRFTGHCLRRTSSTLLMYGKWKTNTVAQHYVEESITSKNRIYNMIASAVGSSERETSRNTALSSTSTSGNLEVTPDFEEPKPSSSYPVDDSV